jgi:glycosyltransferase involved in cell wall biosynthesis
MKKIAFFTQNLDIGGVQKSVSNLANYLSSFYEVNIILAEDNKSISYDINPNIKIKTIKTKEIDVRKEGVGEELFEYRVCELEKILDELRVDLVISYEDYNNLVLLSSKATCKKVISCRVSLSDSYTKNSFIHLLSAQFYFEMIKKFYDKSDLVIAVAKHIEDELKILNPMIESCTIYNGIKKLHVEKSSEVNEKDFILNVGRLHSQKGQKDLLYAFSMIKNKTDKDLLILGDGVLKDELQDLILELNLQDRVFLKGFVNPYPYIQKCSLFVFPSYYEGFSNSVLEVVSMKKVIISYDYKGANEILPSESLVKLSDIKSLAKKMLFYIQNEQDKKLLENKLYKKSQEFTQERSFESFYAKFEQLLRQDNT